MISLIKLDWHRWVEILDEAKVRETRDEWLFDSTKMEQVKEKSTTINSAIQPKEEE